MSIIFGNKIKELRIRENLSQKDVAEELGVDRTTVSLWEKGKCEPSYETLCKLADFFKVTPNDLLGY